MPGPCVTGLSEGKHIQQSGRGMAPPISVGRPRFFFPFDALLHLHRNSTLGILNSPTSLTRRRPCSKTSVDNSNWHCRRLFGRRPGRNPSFCRRQRNCRRLSSSPRVLFGCHRLWVPLRPFGQNMGAFHHHQVSTDYLFLSYYKSASLACSSALTMMLRPRYRRFGHGAIFLLSLN